MNYLEQCKKQALESSKRFYNNDLYISPEADEFLNEIEYLFDTPQTFSYMKNGVKAVINYKDNKFIIDYDYGYANSILITFKNKNNKLWIVETTLKDLKNCIEESIGETNER